MSELRVLVIGAGPAGLSAATRLLERAGDRVRVEVIHMGHHVGGKAASYVDGDGRTVEHGWHMVLGFYRNMRALMRRAGIDVAATLRSMGGHAHPYESFDDRLHTLKSNRSRLGFALSWLGYDGLPFGDRLHYGRFMAQTFQRATSGERLEAHDDICFRTWALEHGLRRHVVDYSLFRNLREVYFNFPESISAYHVLQSMRLMSRPELAEMFVVRGGFSEHVPAALCAIAPTRRGVLGLLAALLALPLFARCVPRRLGCPARVPGKSSCRHRHCRYYRG